MLAEESASGPRTGKTMRRKLVRGIVVWCGVGVYCLPLHITSIPFSHRPKSEHVFKLRSSSLEAPPGRGGSGGPILLLVRHGSGGRGEERRRGLPGVPGEGRGTGGGGKSRALGMESVALNWMDHFLGSIFWGDIFGRAMG